MAFTLAEMRTKVRERANMENSQFVSDTELTGYINSSYAELYDLLVSRFEDYYSEQEAFTITSGNSRTLPVDFYKVRGVDYNSGSGAQTVGRWNFEERNRIGNEINALTGLVNRQYRVMGQSIQFLPIDSAQGSYVLWYIPRFQPLISDTDYMDDVLDFEEYVVVDAARKCLEKEESDIQAVVLAKQQLIARIQAMASNRDTTPERISDVRGDYDGFQTVRGW